MHILITARTGSTRLPYKTVRRPGDRTMLEQIIKKAKQVKSIEGIIVSTSTARDDIIIEHICDRNDVLCFRGSEEDVYQRHLDTFKKFNIRAAIHWHSDSPFVPLELLNKASETYQKHPTHEFYRMSDRWLGQSGGKFCIISRSYLDKVPHIFEINPVFRHSYWQYYSYCHFDPNKKICLFYGLTMEKYLFDVFVVQADKLWEELGFGRLRLKLSIDYPSELAYFNEICDYLGYFPQSVDDFLKAMANIYQFRSITAIEKIASFQ